MKKSFMTRALAMGLSFAMAFSLSAATNVTTASAAAKKASVTSMMKVSSKTVTEGKKVTTYMNSTAAKKYRIKSHTESSVTKKYISVKMTDSRKGLTITAKEGALAAANLEKKGVYVKINFAPAKSVAAVKKAAATKYVKLKVAVVAKAKEEEPEKPVVDTFEMTSLVATSANELTATFASPVASTGAITIKVNKAGSTTAVTGTTKWSDDATSVVFTTVANMTAGTYEMTATDAAGNSTSKTAVVENEKVAEIVIKNDVALTNAAKDEAYIYYEVYNQYHESIKASTSISWTVSTATTPTVNKALGKITAKKSAGSETYTYGSSIFVTGVYTKTGANVQKELKIGMEQGLDSIEVAGFLKKSDKNTILDKLPTNFQKNEYVMLYQTFDQNGDPIDAASNNITNGNVTFICDNPLLMKSDFADDDIYTIGGVEYSSVKIEPGQYVDKGGEINITAISNKTGKKTNKNYLIGAGGLLKKLVLQQPSYVVADNETNVVIPYTAYDTEDNEITNYETIARSTNSLSLTASDGSTLTVKEGNDGKAVVLWSDKTVNFATDNTTWDEVDRSIALTAVVVGGESDNLLLQVSDMARPVAVKSVNFRNGYSTAIVGCDSDDVAIADMTYVDQYNRTMDTSITVNGGTLKSQAESFLGLGSWHNYDYGVKITFNKAASTNFDLYKTDGVTPLTATTEGAILLDDVNSSFVWVADEVKEVKAETVKFSVASVKTTESDGTADCYDDCSKKLNVSYSVVPMNTVTNIALNTLNKQYVSLGLENYKTGAEASITAGALKANTLSDDVGSFDNTQVKIVTSASVDYTQPVKVSGAYKGTPVYVPTTYVEVQSNEFIFDAGNNIVNVSKGALTLGDFFDATKANFARKDGAAKVEAIVYSATSGAITALKANPASAAALQSARMGNPTQTVAISDEAPKPAEIVLPKDPVVNAALTDFAVSGSAIEIAPTKVKVKDQYGKVMSKGASLGQYTGFKYTISDIVENAGELAHLDTSFAVSGNATDDPQLTKIELGDAFTLTYDVYNNYGSANGSVKVTVGADTWANITSGAAVPADETLRGILKYAY